MFMRIFTPVSYSDVHTINHWFQIKPVALVIAGKNVHQGSRT